MAGSQIYKEKQLALVGEYEFYAWVGPSNHRRDIIPDCVLKLVRYWRPNPPGHHTWDTNDTKKICSINTVDSF